LTVVGGGVQVSGGSIVATRTSGGIWVEANNPSEAFQMTNPSGPAGHGGASTGVDTSGRWVANNTNADYGFAFKAAGTYDILRISNTGVAITPSAGSYSVDARSANYSSGGVIGWATGLGAYGICGSYTNPNVWSFYGDQSAY